jgi:hypothetical protein
MTTLTERKLALDESSLLILGTQVLFGFPFHVTFQEMFASVPNVSRWIHGSGLMLLMISICLLIARSLHHQIVFFGESRVGAIRTATWFAGASLLPSTLRLGATSFVSLERIRSYCQRAVQSRFRADGLHAALRRRLRSRCPRFIIAHTFSRNHNQASHSVPRRPRTERLRGLICADIEKNRARCTHDADQCMGPTVGGLTGWHRLRFDLRLFVCFGLGAQMRKTSPSRLSLGACTILPPSYRAESSRRDRVDCAPRRAKRRFCGIDDRGTKWEHTHPSSWTCADIGPAR